MNTFSPAIVIIAYNRPGALKRLLGSVERAAYPSEDVQLVISIDQGGDPGVEKIARDFPFSHGQKRLIVRPEKMGLKRHVLACSALALEYGSVIVLEDDLYVSRDYYFYACAALEHTQSDERLAGVSLYSHRLNVHARVPFEAIGDGSDGWYFQFASSWGQAYSAAQWKAFSDWLSEKDGTPFPDSVPANVRSWGESSWLKYFIRYCVEEDRYFLYPQLSRTTNFSEEGTHSMGQKTDLQVPICTGICRELSFAPLDGSPSVYDAYFENVRLRDRFEGGTVIDLYGMRSRERSMGAGGLRAGSGEQCGSPGERSGRFLLSGASLPYKVVKSYGRLMRPVDMNIFEEVPGEDFFLYDLTERGPAPAVKKKDRLFYDYRAFRAGYGLDMAMSRLGEKVGR